MKKELAKTEHFIQICIADLTFDMFARPKIIGIDGVLDTNCRVAGAGDTVISERGGTVTGASTLCVAQ